MEFGLDGHQLVLHLATNQRIQGAERLVHEQDVRVGAQGAGQADTLLHAARQLTGGVEGVGLETDHGQGLNGRLVAFPLLHALDLEPIGGVVDHVAMGEQGEVLEHHGELLATEGLQGSPSQLLDVGALHHDPPVGDVVELVDRPDGCGLAGT